mmetsp:Transcript_17051/g.65012  ORF Transcript_17051/g.65012 Transcript_17051/m.65012 type:complete len:320 (+) Transcript_17051:420-1379(+)
MHSGSSTQPVCSGVMQTSPSMMMVLGQQDKAVMEPGPCASSQVQPPQMSPQTVASQHTTPSALLVLPTHRSSGVTQRRMSPTAKDTSADTWSDAALGTGPAGVVSKRWLLSPTIGCGAPLSKVMGIPEPTSVTCTSRKSLSESMSMIDALNTWTLAMPARLEKSKVMIPPLPLSSGSLESPSSLMMSVRPWKAFPKTGPTHKSGSWPVGAGRLSLESPLQLELKIMARSAMPPAVTPDTTMQEVPSTDSISEFRMLTPRPPKHKSSSFSTSPGTKPSKSRMTSKEPTGQKPQSCAALVASTAARVSNARGVVDIFANSR